MAGASVPQLSLPNADSKLKKAGSNQRMQPIKQVRKLTEQERVVLRRGLRSTQAFMVRRSEIILMRAKDGLSPGKIGERFRCSDQAVRNTIRTFEWDAVCQGQERDVLIAFQWLSVNLPFAWRVPRLSSLGMRAEGQKM